MEHRDAPKTDNVFPSLVNGLGFDEEASQMDLYEDGYNSSFDYLYRYFCAWVHFMVLVLCNNDGCMLGPTQIFKSNWFLEGSGPSKPQENASFFFFFFFFLSQMHCESEIRRHHQNIASLEWDFMESSIFDRLKGQKLLLHCKKCIYLLARILGAVLPTWGKNVGTDGYKKNLFTILKYLQCSLVFDYMHLPFKILSETA